MGLFRKFLLEGKEKLVFNTISEIKKYKWIGNHYSDQPAFDAIEKFIDDNKNEMHDRAEAVRIYIRDGMGMKISGAATNNELVKNFVESKDK